jgi:hypothetical protein
MGSPLSLGADVPSVPGFTSERGLVPPRIERAKS